MVMTIDDVTKGQPHDSIVILRKPSGDVKDDASVFIGHNIDFALACNLCSALMAFLAVKSPLGYERTLELLSQGTMHIDTNLNKGE